MATVSRIKQLLSLLLLSDLLGSQAFFCPVRQTGLGSPRGVLSRSTEVGRLHATTLSSDSETLQQELEESVQKDGQESRWAAPLQQIMKRRNFAIISHPDSGKTTLTEKLLLYGGAINQAGAVRSRASQRKATSDWMELEKQRGISITSTVLSFEYNNFQINLLDTPGHQDFGEDTYRTLAAADNCVMLIDAGKGLETQTRKLFEVCRLRGLPIYSFINKMDRPSKGPIALLDEIEGEMGLEVCPMVWPIGDGDDFKGVFDRETRQVYLYTRQARTEKASELAVLTADDPRLQELIGEQLYNQLMEDIELLDGVMPELDIEKVIAGKQTPLFFGSAMNNFGVELFLKKFLAISGPPTPRETNIGTIGPEYPEFTGFVFKLQANLNPKHRDRIAFVRICSGRFEKGMKVHHARMKRQISLSQAQQLFAQERETIEEAFPGDIIGLNNPGMLSIGDSLHTGNKPLRFPGIPSFSPEKFAYIQNPNPSKYKNFRKGVDELLEEGAVQLLYVRGDEGQQNPILAAVGQLQFEVVQYRLKEEYGVDSRLEPLSFTAARWSQAAWEDVDKADAEGKIFGTMQCKDRYGRPVLLFRNEWKISQVVEEAASLKLVPWAMAPDFDG